MRDAMRMTVTRGAGRRESFVLMRPPFPEVGDFVRMPDGRSARVVKLVPTRALSLRFPHKSSGKVKNAK